MLANEESSKEKIFNKSFKDESRDSSVSGVEKIIENAKKHSLPDSLEHLLEIVCNMQDANLLMNEIKLIFMLTK